MQSPLAGQKSEQIPKLQTKDALPGFEMASYDFLLQGISALTPDMKPPSGHLCFSF